MRNGENLHRSGDGMMIQQTNTPELPFRKSVAFLLVFYWAVLVAWQNISSAEARSSVDVVIKVGLLAYFSWFYLRRGRLVSGKILWVLLLAVFLLVTAFSETEFPLSNVIAYGYPVIFLTMVYGLGDRYEITRKQLLGFCNWVIGIVLYACIYAFIFCQDQFIGILAVSQAYGNELTSFFLSSHEYGMYLACAMVSCGLCLKYNNQMTRIRKAFYIVVLAVFDLNLVLTFSRTSMAGLAVFLLVFILTEKGRLKWWILGMLLVLGIIILSSPELSDYVYRIVLKENNMANRDNLISGGIRYYQAGSLLEKMFGYGIYDTRIYFEYYLRNGSVHNAYLQVLLYYGAAGFCFLIVFLLTQIAVAVKMIRVDRFFGSVRLGLVGMALLMMFTNTAIIFTSPIDSYFMTVYMFVVPKYVGNAIVRHRFQ